MKCENCDNLEFEEDNEENLLCLKCGCICSEVTTYSHNFQNSQNFASRNLFNRYQNVELKNETLIRMYMSKIQSCWTEDNLLELQSEIYEKLIKYSKNFTSNVIILGTILKYASMKNIPCNLKDHQNELQISTKKLSKFFKEINAGVISEGLCDPEVSLFIEKYGDSHIVRPVSLKRDRGHEVTRTLSKKIWEKSKNRKKGVIIQNQLATFLKMFQDIKNYKIENENIYLAEIDNIVNKFRNHTSIFDREDEIIVILLSTYIILKKYKIIKSLLLYCQETRMTSVPTFSKLYKEYKDFDIFKKLLIPSK